MLDLKFIDGGLIFEQRAERLRNDTPLLFCFIDSCFYHWSTTTLSATSWEAVKDRFRDNLSQKMEWGLSVKLHLSMHRARWQ